MAEKPKAEEKDGVLAVACRKRGGRYEVFVVTRKGGKQAEEVLKSTEDKRIAADHLQRALFRSAL
jgi:hypothetical protein